MGLLVFVWSRRCCGHFWPPAKLLPLSLKSLYTNPSPTPNPTNRGGNNLSGVRIGHNTGKRYHMCVCVCVCVCVCESEREREKGSHHSRVSFLNRGLCANTYKHHHSHTSTHHVSVTQLCSYFRLELMVKLRTLLTAFTFILQAEAHDYAKRHFRLMLVVFVNHNALGQLANQSRLCLSEGGAL